MAANKNTRQSRHVQPHKVPRNVQMKQRVWLQTRTLDRVETRLRNGAGVVVSEWNRNALDTWLRAERSNSVRFTFAFKCKREHDQLTRASGIPQVCGKSE